MTQLTDQLAAVELDMTALRTECQQLRQAAAAGDSGRTQAGAPQVDCSGLVRLLWRYHKLEHLSWLWNSTCLQVDR